MTAPSDKLHIPPNTQEYVHAACRIEGLVHDINNQLGAIMAFAELIALEGDGPSEMQQRVEDILDCVEKSSGLLETLSEMIETRPMGSSAVDVSELVERVTTLYRHELKKEGITLESTFEGDRRPITAIRGLLIRILTFMLADAIHSVSTAHHKSIRILTQEGEDAITITLRNSASVPPPIDPGEESEAGSTEPAESPAELSLARAREYAGFHDGTLTFDSEARLVLRLPRDR